MKDHKKLTRREFVGRSVKAGLAVSAAGGLGLFFHNRDQRRPRRSPLIFSGDFRRGDQEDEARMAVCVGDAPAEITRAAVSALGGMKRFVAEGETVCIKPNAAWDRVPEQAANTHPDIVGAVAAMCLEAGARKVTVTDVSCNDPIRSFARSGIGRAAQDNGARVLIPRMQDFGEVMIQGKILQSWPVFLPVFEADRVINIPVAKHHSLAGLTLGMKNWYGLLGGRRNQLHQKIHDSICDLAAFFRPTLTILDASRILVRNGPQGGSLEDVVGTHTVAASTDPVAIDAYACTLFGREADDIGYVRQAYERGLGEKDWTKLNPVETAL